MARFLLIATLTLAFCCTALGQGTSCTSKADIAFLVDSSGSIDEKADWPVLLTFLRNVINNMFIGPNDVQVATVIYSTTASIDFYLDQHTSKSSVLSAVSGLKYRGHRTNIAGALELSRKEVFIRSHGDRPDAPNVAVLITDGKSTVREGQAQSQATLLKAYGTRVISVGIGKEVNKTELQLIASDPSEYLEADDFAGLEAILNQLLELTCRTEPPRTTATVPDVECPFKADIVLIIDSSGSITYPTYDNWWTLLNFCITVVKAFDIGQDKTKFGMISFSTGIYFEFDLNQYMDKNALIQRINRTRYIGESTNIAGALRMMRNRIFTPSGGDRTDAANIAIVVTDGKANVEANFLDDEAEMAKKEGATLFAVGVTNNVDQRQLETIATDPDRDHIFRVTNFAGLRDIVRQVIDKACRVVTDTPVGPGTRPPPLTTLPPPSDCARQMDVAIVIDASGSVKARNFEVMKKFLTDLVAKLSVDDGRVRIALVAFSDEAHLEFPLNEFRLRKIMSRRIRNIEYYRGTTNTAAAIKMVREQVFTVPNGDRPSAENLMIVLTDGGSNNKRETLREAESMRLDGTHVISVGIGDWLNHVELESLASYPADKNTIYSQDFKALNSIINQLQAAVCDNSGCRNNPCRNGQCRNLPNGYACRCFNNYIGKNCDRRCTSKPQVVFLVDESGSVGELNFKLSLDFVYNMIDEMDGIEVGMLTFATNVSINFNLNDYRTKVDRLNALYTPYKGGTTNTADAIKVMREQMFRGRGGDKVAIVLTDGRSNDPEKTWMEAALAKTAGIHMVAIGVGGGVNAEEMNDIASSQKDVYSVKDFSALQTLQAGLIRVVCNDENECTRLYPCRNGARCQDLRNGYSCGPCPQGYSGKNCERRCDGQSDVVFVIDASGSIRNERFGKVLDFASSIVEELDVHQDRVRVGAVSWSDDSKMGFHLNQYKTRYDVIRALKHIRFQGGRTNTVSALRMMREKILVQSLGDRPNVANFAIIITDGNSNINSTFTVPEAILARVEGTHIIVVSVGSDLRQVELDAMASMPVVANRFAVERISELSTLTSKLISATCDDRDECRSNPCRFGRCEDRLNSYMCLCHSGRAGMNCDRSCSRQMDIVFVLDLSASTDDEFRMIIDFTRAAVYNLDLSFERVRVGVITYSTDVQIQFHLNRYKGREEILNAIAFFNEGGRTNTQGALKMMLEQMFTNANGDRVGVDNIAIVVSDGDSNIDPANTIPMAEDAKKEGIEIYAVAVGPNARLGEINGIASDPDNTHVYEMVDSTSVNQAADDLMAEICQ